MVYWLRYNSKINDNNNVNIIYNTTNKKFYVWKTILFSQKHLLNVIENEKNYPLLDMRTQADIKEFINTMRKDKNFTEV